MDKKQAIRLSVVLVLLVFVLLSLILFRIGIFIIPRNPIQSDGITALYVGRTKEMPFLTVPQMCEISPDGMTIMANHFPEYNKIHESIFLKIRTDFWLFRGRYRDCLYPER